MVYRQINLFIIIFTIDKAQCILTGDMLKQFMIKVSKCSISTNDLDAIKTCASTIESVTVLEGENYFTWEIIPKG